MLEQMRQQSRSLLIYLLFGIVIAVFIVNFGPQSPSGCDRGQSRMTESAARVGDRVLSLKDYQYGLMMLDRGFPPKVARQVRLKETIMDLLIQRELLASEAERLGFRVTDQEVEDMLMHDAKMLALGQPQRLPALEDGELDAARFSKFRQFQLGMTERSFIDQQRRELLAARMREMLRSSVAVSPNEVQDDWVRTTDQANAEFVRFQVSHYDSEVELRPEDIAAYVKANQDKLKKIYEQRKPAVYDKQPRQRRLRQILVKLAADADADTTAAASKKADEIAARVRKGESFAKVAKAVSDDGSTKGRGGDLGWQRSGGTTLGPEAEAKVWQAKDGELVGPIKTGAGFMLVMPEGTREGDISFEQASAELAEAELRQEKAVAMAKADAEAALARAKAAPGKALKEVFPAAEGDAAKATAPKAEETGLFARRGALVPTIGPAPVVAKAIFSLTDEQPFAGPLDEAGAFTVLKLKERKKPDMAEFAKEKMRLTEDAGDRKGGALVLDWAQKRCREAKDANRIQVNLDLLRYEDGAGPTPYEACMPVRF
jgi:peptidyl-prolyl cis-trans isomerase D